MQIRNELDQNALLQRQISFYSAPVIAALKLTDFRSYGQAHLALPDPHQRLVFIVGPNGAGKTNLLEALSILSGGGACAGLPMVISKNMAARGT